MTTRGHFIVVVGPDGVGKTSVARALLAEGGKADRYFHFRPESAWHEPDPGAEQAHLPAAEPSYFIGWLRAGYHLGRCWVAYVRRIRPALQRGENVFGDRWLYSYVGSPDSLGFRGPEWLGRLIAWAAPRPSLVANLTAAPELIIRRKGELSIDEIEAQCRLWASVPVPRLGSFSAADPPSAIARRIRSVLR